MALSGTLFSLTLDELRDAWRLASDADKPYIEWLAERIKVAE